MVTVCAGASKFGSSAPRMAVSIQSDIEISKPIREHRLSKHECTQDTSLALLKMLQHDTFCR